MERLPADDAGPSETCTGERAAEQCRRKRLRQPQQTDQEQQQDVRRGQQQGRRQQNVEQSEQQSAEPRDVQQGGLLRTRRHLEGRAAAEQAVSAAARLSEAAAPATAQATAGPAAVNRPKQGEVQETRQVQQPVGELSVNQQRPVLPRREEREGSELSNVVEAMQQLTGNFRLGTLVSQNVLSSRLHAWQPVQREHSSLEQEHMLQQQHMLVGNPHQQLRRQQSEIREYPGLQQQLSQDVHARPVSERQRQQQPVELAEPTVDSAQAQAQQHRQQREAQQHSAVRQRWGPPFDSTQDDKESLEDVLAAIAEVEDGAEAPANGYPSDYAEQSHDVPLEQRMPLESESPQREPARQKLDREEDWRRWQQRRKSANQVQQETLHQEGQVQQNPERQQESKRQRDRERQQEDEQREESAELPSMNPRLPYVGGKPQSCEQQCAPQREPSERLSESHVLGTEEVRQEQCVAETQQLDTQQPLEQQRSEAEGRSSQEQHQGRALLHSHQQGKWKEASVCGESCLQRELSEIDNQEQEGEFNDAQQEQRSIQQASSKHHLQEHAVPSTPVIVPRPRKLLRETEFELDEEVCDFLEAGLPPSAVIRWSDYLRLRQQQHQLQEQQQGQLQQQQRHRQDERQQRQTVSGELSFRPTAAAPPGADPRFRQSARLVSDERLRKEAFQSATSVPCFPESLTISSQRTPRRVVARTDRGPHSSSSPYSTSSTPRAHTSPRSATAGRFASSNHSTSNMLRRSSGGASNNSSSNVEALTNSRSGEACSNSIAGSSDVNNNIGRRSRATDDCRGSSSSTSARIINEGAFHSFDTSRNAVGASSRYSRFLDVHGDISAVYERVLPRPTFLSSCSSGAQIGGPTVTPGAALAPVPHGMPFPSADVHSRRSTRLSSSSAPSGMCASPKTPPVATASNFSSSSSTGALDNGSAPNCRASQLATHEHSQAERAAASSAFSDAPSSLVSTSAAAPEVQGALTSQAARRSDGDALSAAVRRPVPLEVFFQVRGNRPGDTASPRSLTSSTTNRVAADPLLRPTDCVTPDTHRLSHSALPMSTHTLERPVGAGTAGSPSAASSDTPSILPSFTAPSSAIRRAAARGVSSSSLRLSSTAGVQIAAASESLLRGSTIPPGLHVSSSPGSSGVRNTASIDERTAAAITTFPIVDAADSGSNAADEPSQTSTDIRVTVREDQGNSRLHQVASQPSTEVMEGAKGRRDSAIGSSASGKTRRFIYLKTHEECIVCFVEIRIKGEVAMVEDCRHCFCCACLARWIKKSKTCPLCRRPVTTVELWRHARATLVKNSLAYGFLRRLRPDKNNVLKPVTLPRRRPGGQRGRGNNQAKTAPGASADVVVESTRHASTGEEA